MLWSGARRSAELRSPSPLPRLRTAPARPPLRVRSPFAPLRVSARGSRYAASAPLPASLRSRRLPLRSRRRALRSVSSACPCVSRGPRPCVRAASPPSRCAQWLRGSAPAVGCPLAPRRPSETVHPYKISGKANPRPREGEGERERGKSEQRGEREPPRERTYSPSPTPTPGLFGLPPPTPGGGFELLQALPFHTFIVCPCPSADAFLPLLGLPSAPSQAALWLGADARPHKGSPATQYQAAPLNAIVKDT